MDAYFRVDQQEQRRMAQADIEQGFRDSLEESLTEALKAVKEGEFSHIPAKIKSVIIDLKYELENLEEYLEGQWNTQRQPLTPV